MSRRIKESAIERSWVDWCRDNDVLQIKMEKRRGWPDRLVLPDNHEFGINNGAFITCFFIEFKTPTGELTALQEHTIKKLRDRGYAVYVCRSKAEAIEACQKEGCC